MNDRTQTFIETALACAELGWRVIPLRPPNLRPWPGEEPSTSADQIRYWWSKFPQGVVGVATGPRSKLLVLDDGTDVPDTAPVSVVDGVRQWWCAYPVDREPAKPCGVVVAPLATSILRVSGKAIFWERWPTDAPLPEAPEWALIPRVDGRRARRDSVVDDPRFEATLANALVVESNTRRLKLAQEHVRRNDFGAEGTEYTWDETGRQKLAVVGHDFGVAANVWRPYTRGADVEAVYAASPNPFGWRLALHSDGTIIDCRPHDEIAQPTVSFADYVAAVGGRGAQFAIQDWLPEKSVVMAVAKKGCNKTWLGYDALCSLLLGEPFLGVPVEKSDRPCLVYQQEDPEDVTAERLKTVLSAKGYTGGYGELPLIMHSNRSLRLDDEDSVDALIGKVARIKPRLVLIDPLYAASETMTMGDFGARITPGLSRLKAAAQANDTIFLLAHHAKGDNEPWGSIFLRAPLDGLWCMSRAADPGAVRIERVNMKAIAAPPVVRVRFEMNTKLENGPLQYRTTVDGAKQPEAKPKPVIGKPKSAAEAVDAVYTAGMTQAQCVEAVEAAWSGAFKVTSIRSAFQRKRKA